MNRKDDYTSYMVNGFLPTIGVECHVQLKTATKLFNSASNVLADDEPANSLVSYLCLGLPGTLPVLNQRAVELAIRAGLVLEAEIAGVTRFDRKHYFYPDLPLGYQISQHDMPIVGPGKVVVPLEDGSEMTVRLIRAHLEADAGKLTHPGQADHSLLDLNRVGSPLLEIVSQPDMHSARQVRQYSRELYLRMIYAEVCEGDLFKGNLRFDVNVSLSSDPSGQVLGTRCEIKNLNSFRFVEQAVDYEIKRQIGILSSGQEVAQETRGFNEETKETFSQRSKEDAQDYRYMPDPDIPPLVISQELVDSIRQGLALTPRDVRRVLAGLNLDKSVLETILDNPRAGEFIVRLSGQEKVEVVESVAKWLVLEIQNLLKDGRADWERINQAESDLIDLAKLTLQGEVSSSLAKNVINQLITGKTPLAQILEASQQNQIKTSELDKIVAQVLNDHPQQVEQAKSEPKVIGFLIGQVIQKTNKQADPKLVADRVKQALFS